MHRLREVLILSLPFQDACNESNPRIIDDSRARKLANDLKRLNQYIQKIAEYLTLYHLPTCRCAYYETCATYGLNVERVFQDGESSSLIHTTTFIIITLLNW